jgi:DNA-binding CsgD family transcriptional regulator
MARLADAPLSTPAARHARARILTLGKGRADTSFLAELSDQLRAIVPFDGAFWAAADPTTALARSPARVENLASPSACAAYWDAEFLIHDYILFRDLARAPSPAASLFRATEGRPARSLRFKSVNRMMGFDDELRAVFRTNGGTWGVVSLYRREGAQPFSAAEEKLLAELSEPIAQPFRRAALVRQEPPTDGLGEPGLLMFDATGVLESMNEQAERWLAELPVTSVRGNPSSGAIPTEVLTVSARARAIAAGLDDGVARAQIRTLSGRWLVIHGFALRGANGSPARTALMIEPARASQVAPIIVEAYGLTPRERQITQMISRGLSTEEIAARMYLSAHTVRDYVKQVFEKVGVSSRGELVARIFSEHLLPDILESASHAR